MNPCGHGYNQVGRLFCCCLWISSGFVCTECGTAYFWTSYSEGGCKVLDYLDCKKHKAFAGRVIKSFKVFAPGLERCQQKCFLEDKCVSYNLGPVEGITRLCELIDADHWILPSHLTSKEGFEYCPIKNPCSSNPCPANQWCTPDFRWDSFQCTGGRWTEWSSWSFWCPKTRIRRCITPQNTTGVCTGPDKDGPHACKALSNVTGCLQPLGIQDGRITDSQITASSNDGLHCRPSYARLHKKTSILNILTYFHCSWCAKTSKLKSGQYLQIDLGSVKWVTRIATQGRPCVDQWVKEYTVSFSLNNTAWEEYKADQDDTKHFVGNTDRNTVVTHELPVSIKTRYIRIVVQKWGGQISMRVELYGCTSL